MQVFAMASDGNTVVGVDDSKGSKFDLTKAQTTVNINKIMKKTLFSAAFLWAVGKLRRNPDGFSVYDITKLLRDEVNAGNLEFTDRQKQDVDGQDTFKVSHDEVKMHFNTYIMDGILNNLDKKIKFKDGASFFVYSNNISAGVPPVIPTGVITNSKPPHNLIPVNFAASDSEGQEILNKVDYYLTNYLTTEEVTMKMIQSRFKGISKTCKQIADLLTNAGYTVFRTSLNSSEWYLAGLVV